MFKRESSLRLLNIGRVYLRDFRSNIKLQVGINRLKKKHYKIITTKFRSIDLTS